MPTFDPREIASYLDEAIVFVTNPNQDNPQYAMPYLEKAAYFLENLASHGQSNSSEGTADHTEFIVAEIIPKLEQLRKLLSDQAESGLLPSDVIEPYFKEIGRLGEISGYLRRDFMQSA